MAHDESALSFIVAVHQAGKLLVSVIGTPTVAGTNVVVSHTGDFDQNELSMMIADVLAMSVRSILDPDAMSYVTRPGDFIGMQNETPDDTSEIPF